MADLERRTSRAVREQRAYRFAVTGGIATVVAVVGVIGAIIGFLPGGVPLLAIVVAVVCAVLFRRTVS